MSSAPPLTLDALRARLNAPKDNPKQKEPTLDERLEQTSLKS